MVNREHIIIDTDAGGDPDDALAIGLARNMPNVIALVTSDEIGGDRRAHFVRSLAGRVPVIAGLASPNPGKHVLDYLRVESRDPIPMMQDELPGIIDSALRNGPVSWIGIGSYTNLAWLIERYPRLASELRVTLMGGRLNHTEHDRPEHNFKVDPSAAMKVSEAISDLTFVPTTVTTNEATRVDASHSLIAYLSQSDEEWCAAALQNFEVWFDNRFPASYQHDALTLAIATHAIRRFDTVHVRATPTGGLVEDDSSSIRAVSGNVDYDGLWRWIWDTLQ